MAIRVAHVSFSSAGGAGGVASILASEQRRQGIEARLVTRLSSDLRSEPLTSPLHTLAAATDQYLVKSGRFSAPISLLRDAVSAGIEGQLESATLVHLHGVNGALSPSVIARIGQSRPLVWTLHDMNPFTGGCHYSLGCEGYATSCSGCPAVRMPWRPTIESRLTKKTHSFASIDRLEVIAPSTWLANQARDSRALQGHDIRVIPNPVADHFFAPAGETRPRAPEAPFRFLVAAQNLDDPIKQVSEAVEGFRALRQGGIDAELVLVGRGASSWKGPGISQLGSVPSRDLPEILDRVDVLLVPSRAENAPLIIAEAAARGVATIARDVGGMPEMIRWLGTGEVFGDTAELLAAMRTVVADGATGDPAARVRLANRAKDVFSPAVVASEYAKVYSGIATQLPKDGK